MAVGLVLEFEFEIDLEFGLPGSDLRVDSRFNLRFNLRFDLRFEFEFEFEVEFDLNWSVGLELLVDCEFFCLLELLCVLVNGGPGNAKAKQAHCKTPLRA